MSENLYKQFVDLLREKYPVLSLVNVINDIEASIEEFGIQIKYSDMSHLDSDEEISGYVHVVNGIPEMVINVLQNKKRQRFTIAHELGHILIHWGWEPAKTLPGDLVDVSYRKRTYRDDEVLRERQADSFAAEFLSPIDDVVKYLEENKKFDSFKEVQIGMIAERFKISNPSAYYRWKEASEILNGI